MMDHKASASVSISVFSIVRMASIIVKVFTKRLVVRGLPSSNSANFCSLCSVLRTVCGSIKTRAASPETASATGPGRSCRMART